MALTGDEYNAFERAYGWFNARLFAGGLPPCLITLQRHPNSRGYYWHDAFRARRGKARTAEIALNPDAFTARTDQQILSTLVHEMVHLWQAHFGTPGRGRYHNEEWAKRMEAVGLMPSDSGEPGGRRTGDHMTHYVVRGGRFQRAWAALYRTGFRLHWQTDVSARPGRAGGRGKDPSKRKFTCPNCGINAWGAASLAGKLMCAEDLTRLEAAD
jgi:hypothetical protein